MESGHQTETCFLGLYYSNIGILAPNSLSVNLFLHHWIQGQYHVIKCNLKIHTILNQ